MERIAMLKILTAVGLGSMLMLAPVFAYADNPPPADTMAPKPPMEHHVHHYVHHVYHHVYHHHMAAKPMMKKPDMAPEAPKT
jgi:hypothetical protein